MGAITPDNLTPQEAAELVGVTPATVALFSAQGALDQSKQAWRTFARQYHPDVLGPDVPQEVKEEKLRVFNIMRAAHEVIEEIAGNKIDWENFCFSLGEFQGGATDKSDLIATAQLQEAIVRAERAAREFEEALEQIERFVERMSVLPGDSIYTEPTVVNWHDMNEKRSFPCFNLYQPGTYRILCSEPDPRDSAPINVTFITDEFRNIRKVSTTRRDQKGAFDFLIGATIIGAVPEAVFKDTLKKESARVRFDSEPISRSPAHGNKRLTAKGEDDCGPIDIKKWLAVSRQDFREKVLQSMKATFKEGECLVFALYNQDEPQYYISFSIGLEALMEKRKDKSVIAFDPV